MKKYTVVGMTEVTREEFIMKKKDYIKLKQQELENVHKSYQGKIIKIEKRIKEIEDEIRQAEQDKE